MLADENIRKGLEAKVSAAEKELSQFQVGCIIFIITTEDLIFFFFPCLFCYGTTFILAFFI